MPRCRTRLGARWVVLGFHLLASLLLTAAAIASGVFGAITAHDLLVAALAGVLGWTSYLVFYRALAIGPISVVSPIVSGYATVAVILAVLVLGDRPSTAQWVAIALSIGGVAVAATDGGRTFRAEVRDPAGIVLGLVAMVLIGAFLFVLASQSPRAGWLLPLLLGRLVSTVLLLGQMVAVDGLRVPRADGRTWLHVAFLGVVDTLGYACVNIGVRHESTAIVGAASAPYAVVPIVVGVLVLRERPSGPEWTGVAATIGGVVLLGLVA
jgi:drug/metabolite transporter (DMT)-like permease